MPRYNLRTLMPRLTALEWLVIAGIVIVAVAVLLPSFPVDFDAPPRR